MRQRVVRVAVVAALVALVLLAAPLAVIIRISFYADERGELERDALSAAARVSAQLAAGEPVHLPPAHHDGTLGVYDPGMRLLAGTGPDPGDALTRRAAESGSIRESTGGRIAVAVPLSTTERTIGVVRVATDSRDVRNRVLWSRLGLLGAALLALGAAILVARRQARALSAPLESLSRTSQAVADGDLTARAGSCGIVEIDRVAATQNTMVHRLTLLLEHERHFTTNASHQLRTPLTGLQLGLEGALTTPDADLRAALREALDQSQHLHRTIDEVLRLARSTPAGGYVSRPAGELVGRAEHRWHGALARDGRRLDLAIERGAANLPVAEHATEQILDVLLDNAREHGSGTVRVTLRELGAAVAVDIRDEGTLILDPATLFDRGATTGAGQGIGLSLARDLAEGVGGRLAATGTSPTTFTLLVPILAE
ncbi:sensor histidine kinase [Embleya scabrispora]|uniref:sensor histidine kinase n=1 Tax=Embleya scabrispora TaxID=159449 RepID=UPI000594F029|nr:HAMP domain-containing sensor histidine kinase [Embleya scabrispora]MYS82527.1 HAMP domain-containing protein [Streptomyces sp. SID5474]